MWFMRCLPAGSLSCAFSALRWEGTWGNARRRPLVAILALLLSLLVLGSAGYIGYNQWWAYGHWSQAQEAVEAYEFRRAAEHLKQCLTVWPRDAETHFALGRAYRRDGDILNARKHLQEARSLGWPEEAVNLEHTLIQVQTGSVRAAESRLQGYIQAAHPDDLLILEALVSGYLQNNLLNETYRWASVWIERYPHMWQPYYMRGLALERGLKPSLAAQDYQQVLQIKPDQFEARLQLALILLRSGQFREALPHLDICHRARPTDVNAAVGLARCHWSLRQPEAARATLDRLFTRQTVNGEALLLRGQIELDLAGPQAALKWLTSAEAEIPYQLELVHTLAQVHRRLQNTAEAEKYEQRKQTIEKDLRQVEALTRRILELELAREAPDKAEVVRLRYEVGLTLTRLGQEEAAIPWLVSVLQEDPDHERARQALLEHQRKAAQRHSAGQPVRPLPAVSPEPGN
jgi:tetratricopeptide (TPR) repeat protein